MLNQEQAPSHPGGTEAGPPAADDAPDTSLHAAREVIAHVSDSLHAAADELHAEQDDAWHRYVAEADDAIEHMQAELALAGEQLRAERAETMGEVKAALEQATREWRSRADEIRLRTHLGQMEARDAGLVALDGLDAAGHRLASFVDLVRHDAGTLTSTIKEGARQVIEDARAAIAGLALAAEDDDETS